MSGGTDFNFGWNQARDNAAPWDGERGRIADSLPKILLDKRYSFMHDYDCTCNECINVNFIANRITKELHALTREVGKVAKTMSPSAAEILKNSGNGQGGNLLHGSDVPKKTSKFTVDVLQFRSAPEGFQGSLGILDLKPVFGCEAWALNKTNFKAVAAKFGDNTDKWKGKLNLQVIQVRNPKSGTFGPSLAVAQ